MNHSRMIATLFQNLFYPVLFAEVLFLDKLDLQAIFFGNALSVISKLVAQRFGKTRIIKYTNIISIQKRCHALGITEYGKCSLDNNSIEEREYSPNFLGISFCQ